MGPGHPAGGEGACGAVAHSALCRPAGDRGQTGRRAQAQSNRTDRPRSEGNRRGRRAGCAGWTTRTPIARVTEVDWWTRLRRCPPYSLIYKRGVQSRRVDNSRSDCPPQPRRIGGQGCAVVHPTRSKTPLSPHRRCIRQCRPRGFLVEVAQSQRRERRHPTTRCSASSRRNGLECVSTRERGHDRKRGLFALADTTDVAGHQT